MVDEDTVKYMAECDVFCALCDREVSRALHVCAEDREVDRQGRVKHVPACANFCDECMAQIVVVWSAGR